jgi:hypothetical protein
LTPSSVKAGQLTDGRETMAETKQEQETDIATDIIDYQETALAMAQTMALTAGYLAKRAMREPERSRRDKQALMILTDMESRSREWAIDLIPEGEKDHG